MIQIRHLKAEGRSGMFEVSYNNLFLYITRQGAPMLFFFIIANGIRFHMIINGN